MNWFLKHSSPLAQSRLYRILTRNQQRIKAEYQAADRRRTHVIVLDHVSTSDPICKHRMPPKKFPTIWNAPPHTIAKIKMLRAYLVAWFQILGRSRRGQDLLYVDGFAGPGEYVNYPTGSPLAALSAAEEALALTASQWKGNSNVED